MATTLALFFVPRFQEKALAVRRSLAVLGMPPTQQRRHGGLGAAYGASLTVVFYALIVLRQILAVEVLSPGWLSLPAIVVVHHCRQHRCTTVNGNSVPGSIDTDGLSCRTSVVRHPEAMPPAITELDSIRR